MLDAMPLEALLSLGRALPLVILACVFVANGIQLVVATVGLLGTPDALRRDFTQDYLWARAAAAGVDPYQPLPVLADRFLGDVPTAVFPHPTPHPPTIGLFFLPLAAFDLYTASIIWLGVELAGLAAFVAVLGVHWRLRRPWLLALIVPLILMNWVAMTGEIGTGQMTVPILLCVTLAWYALARGRSFLSGLFLGLALCLKPIVAPVALVYLLRRDTRALAGMAAPLLLALALAVALIGWPPIASWPAAASQVNRDYGAVVHNISVWALGQKLFAGVGSTAVLTVTAPPLVDARPAAFAVPALLIAAYLAFAVAVTRRVKEPADAVGMLCCFGILLSPIVWDCYLVVALQPMALIIRWLVVHRLPRRETYLAFAFGLVLLLPTSVWVALAAALDGKPAPEGQAVALSALPVTLTLIPTVAVSLLGWFTGALATRGDSPLSS